MKKTGKLIISLDFELMWGSRDKKTIQDYGENILGVWESLPKMIETFEEYQVRATFATVGFLFATTKNELIKYSPINKPQYLDKNLSPYNGHFDMINDNEYLDKYHYASELITLLQKYPNQEIATHTFSHYYCLENGQTKENFRNDMESAIKIAKSKNINLKSLVFPRNQFNEEYIKIINELGITSYRGNEKSRYYKASSAKKDGLSKRLFRLIDSYINISGHNSYSIDKINKNEPLNIPSSRFLRPYSSKLKKIENFKLKRILNSMTYAAKKEEIYHLWWHPHNFGVNQKENLLFLSKILKHYKYLNYHYQFESLTMNELTHKKV